MSLLDRFAGIITMWMGNFLIEFPNYLAQKNSTPSKQSLPATSVPVMEDRRLLMTILKVLSNKRGTVWKSPIVFLRYFWTIWNILMSRHLILIELESKDLTLRMPSGMDNINFGPTCLYAEPERNISGILGTESCVDLADETK